MRYKYTPIILSLVLILLTASPFASAQGSVNLIIIDGHDLMPPVEIGDPELIGK